MFDRWLPEEVEFAEDVQQTLSVALAALHRLGHPILWIPQPKTRGDLHMRQAATLADLRAQLGRIAPCA